MTDSIETPEGMAEPWSPPPKLPVVAGQEQGRANHFTDVSMRVHHTKPIEGLADFAMQRVWSLKDVVFVEPSPACDPRSPLILPVRQMREEPAPASAAREEIEAVIACLGDDAATLRAENDDDERADNMDRAAALLGRLLSASPAPEAQRGDDFSGIKPPMRHISGMSMAVLQRAAERFQPAQAEAAPAVAQVPQGWDVETVRNVFATLRWLLGVDGGGGTPSEELQSIISTMAAWAEPGPKATQAETMKQAAAARALLAAAPEAPAHAEAPSEREAFEAWFTRGGDYEPEWLIRSGANPDLYMDHETENLWQAFQAGRAALATQPQAGQDSLLSLLQRARLYTHTTPIQSERTAFTVFRSDLDAAIAALEKQ